MADSKSSKPVAKRVPLKTAEPTRSAAPMAANAVSAPAATLLAAEPVAAEPVAVTPDTVAAPAAREIIDTPVAAATIVQKEAKPMTDTVTQFAEDTKTRAEAAFGELQTRAKAVVEKSQASLSDAAEFGKGNVEAVVASAKVAAKGAQDIAAYSVEYGKGAIEKAVADTKRLYAVKSPTEFFTVQSEIAKANVDEAVSQVSKFTENYLKLVGEIVQPLSNRYALAAEKVKTAVAA